MSREVPRRGVLQGMGALGIGVGGGTGSPWQLAAALDEAVQDAESSRHDQHTVATWRAVVDAVIPETPELADDLGEEHGPGGLDVELEIGLIEFVNGFLSPEGTVPRVAPTGETAPLAESVAAALDTAAAELLARGGNRDPPERRFEGGGPFASLSRRDRFRAMADMEERGGKYGGFVVAIAAAFPAVLYYSEWSGYDDFTKLPAERRFSGDVQSWTQTDYEGPTNGAAVLRGYEVDEFEETYGDDATQNPRNGRGSGDGSGPPDDTADGSADASGGGTADGSGGGSDGGSDGGSTDPLDGAGGDTDVPEAGDDAAGLLDGDPDAGGELP